MSPFKREQKAWAEGPPLVSPSLWGRLRFRDAQSSVCCACQARGGFWSPSPGLASQLSCGPAPALGKSLHLCSSLQAGTRPQPQSWDSLCAFWSRVRCLALQPGSATCYLRDAIDLCDSLCLGFLVCHTTVMTVPSSDTGLLRGLMASEGLACSGCVSC